MMGEELDKFIDSLPDIDTYKRPGGRCYAFSYSGENSYSVLLDTGRLVVIASNSIEPVGIAQRETCKQALKESLKNHKYIGIGIYHRHVRSR